MSAYDLRWEERFGELEAFKRTFGHCNVPARYSENASLGQWVRTQRREKAQGRLSEERAARLSALGFRWNRRQQQRHRGWSDHYKELQAFQAMHGHTHVPRSMASLAAWANMQRKLHREGGLSSRRRALLSNLGFDLDAQMQTLSREERWNEQYSALRAYSEANGGSCAVPQRYPANPSLGVWVHTQRRADAAGKLKPERKKLLAALGFDFGSSAAEEPRPAGREPGVAAEAPAGASGRRAQAGRRPRGGRAGVADREFEQRLKELQSYRSRHGHCNVPRRDARRLGLAIWVAEQQALAANGQLPEERALRLRGVGLKLPAGEEAWEVMFGRLSCAVERLGGGAGLHSVSAEDEQAGRWLQQQRRDLRRRMLPERRAARIRGLGGDLLGEGREVESYGEIWEQRFAELEAHARSHGFGLSLMPPRLKAWVTAQRESRRKGTLAPSRVELLEDLGLAWLPSWEAQFAELVQYWRKHGDCLVPQHFEPNPQLGVWVRTQRRSHRLGTLRPERAEQLDALGFHWGEDPCEQGDAWEAHVAELEAFRRSAPAPQMPPPGSPLARWLEAQAHEHRMGRLSSERRARLMELGGLKAPAAPGVALSIYDRRWEDGFRLLAEHVDACKGRYRPPEDPQLALWVKNQRQLRISGSLAEERIRRLADLGLCWGYSSLPQPEEPEEPEVHGGRAPSEDGRAADDPRSAMDAEWWRFHARLAAFQQRYRHCRVPAAVDAKLAAWISRQRRLANEGLLTQERFQAMNSLGFAWSEGSRNDRGAAAAAWARRYQELQRFALREGHCRLPAEEQLLRDWAGLQRRLRRRGLLAQERAERLESLGFDWEDDSSFPGITKTGGASEHAAVLEEAWEARFKDLQEFVAINGHCQIPPGGSSQALADWVELQQFRYESGAMTPSQEQRLVALGMVWGPGWDNRFEELISYMRKNGDCAVPGDGEHASLSAWCEDQRSAMKVGGLSQDRVAQLDRLGFNWE